MYTVFWRTRWGKSSLVSQDFGVASYPSVTAISTFLGTLKMPLYM